MVRMTMQSLLGSVFGAALLASSSSTVFAQAPDGYFTKEQAASGAALFSANCAQCHGAQLQGDEAPALKGKDVMGSWITAQGIYDYFSVAMPPSNPGQLGNSAYIEILSHILSTNGASAGSRALQLADLPKIELVKATAAGSAPAAAPANAAAAPSAPKLPQAFTAGKALPTVGDAPKADAAAPAAPKLPQAFTAGKTLPTAAPSNAPLELPGPGAPR
jgi:mono/diheme cytochrome c family protein